MRHQVSFSDVVSIYNCFEDSYIRFLDFVRLSSMSYQCDLRSYDIIIHI